MDPRELIHSLFGGTNGSYSGREHEARDHGNENLMQARARIH